MAFSFLSLSQEIKTIAEKTRGYLFHNSISLKMTAGACSLPKQNDDKPLGEDAYFISGDEQTIGVADGVGSYAEHGIDSGIYARELMNNALDFIQNHSSKGVNPMKVLKHAFENSKAEGASTACIITLKDNALRAVNIGDSGFLVIRSGKIVYRSPVQQSFFNCPFQLAVSGGRTPGGDAEEVVVKVKQGDAVVAATDGLFDNVFEGDVVKIVKECLEARVMPERMAITLGKLARKMSYVRDTASPFTMEAVRNGLDRDKYLGGKYDDVTVIVGYVY